MARESSRKFAGKTASTRSTTTRKKAAPVLKKLTAKTAAAKKTVRRKTIFPASLPAAPMLTQSIDPEVVRARAWEIWNREGCPSGRDLDHWLLAEQELRNEAIVDR